jgi:hypothetical protein
MILGLLISSSVQCLSQPEPEPSVQVELTVRGSDGHIVADKAVEIKAVEQTKTPQAEQAVTTDSQGVARFKVRPGYFSLAITVHGIGYGMTTPTNFEQGAIAHPTLPLLAGYGSIDGTTPSSCPPEAHVGISSSMYGAVSSVRADKSGHFHADDVPGGDWDVFASSNACVQQCGMVLSVHVNVGEETKGVTLGKVLGVCTPPASMKATTATSPTVVAPKSPQSTPAPSGPSGKTTTPDNNPAGKSITLGHPIKSDTPIIWAQGRVTDEGGNPIENASVYALGTFYGGIRMQEIASKATTDKNGHYELKGASGLSNFSATLVATAPGHPPAWAWPTFPQISWIDSNPSVPEPITQDMVLPSKSGRMSVTVLHDGQPAQGVNVAVYLENANLRDIWARGAGGGVRDEIEDLVHPAAATDATGTVRFENLLPGSYKIYALAKGKIVEVRGLASFPQGRRGEPAAIATGISVQVGEETRHTLNIYEEPSAASFIILNLDGTALQGNVPIQLGTPNAIQGNSAITLDSNGQGHWEMTQGGLSQIRLIHKKDSSTGGFRSPQDYTEPYDAATVLLAVSPNLPNPPVTVLQMRRIEPPAVDVVVQDNDGNPVRATVSILKGSYPFQKSAGTGSTDANGEISIAGLESGIRYYVHVTGTELAAGKNLTWDYWTGNPATADQVKTRSVFIDEAFLAIAESQQRIVVRPTLLGYAFGAVHSSAIPLDQLGAWLDRQPQGWDPKFLLSQATGEFVAGPFPPGPNLLHLRLPVTNKVVTVPIDIDPKKEQQSRLDIDLDQYVAAADETTGIIGTPNAYLGMGGISTQATGAQHLVGKVFLSDGTTPALGAEVLYFEAGSVSPPILAMTDALGELRPRGLWRGQSDSSADTTPLQSSAIVALLPGESGATIYTGPIHRDEPLRIVLPPPVSVSGVVSVGGKSLLQLPGVVHIVAEYQDKGVLNSALSIETTADAEGRFILNGLTPGTYLVQAALDDIWISSVSDLHVSGEKLQTIRLAIPAPGAPVHIILLDHDGKAVVGRATAIERSGPLAGLWPKVLRSDGTGSIFIPTLEAGRHFLRVDQVSKPVEFDVPALPATSVVVKVRTGL